MARIPMTGGYTPVPEGTHVFRIYNVDYDPTFGKLVVHLVTAKGETHREYFNFINKDQTMNEIACNIFSILAKTALNNNEIEEIDHTDIVNHYVKADVTRTPSTKNDGTPTTYTKLSNFAVAEGFDTTPVEKALTLGTTPTAPKTTPTPAPALAPAENKSVDLASLLG